MARAANSVLLDAHARRIVRVASPGTQILDVVGPFQIFTRAAELFAAQHDRSPRIYCVEVVSTSRDTRLVTSCGLPIEGHQTFRTVRGEIDTLLVAGGGQLRMTKPVKRSFNGRNK